MSWFLSPGRWPVTPAQWLEAADTLARLPTRRVVELVEAVASQLVGREVEIRSRDRSVTVNLDRIHFDHPEPSAELRAVFPGRDVEAIALIDIATSDVRWDDRCVDRLEISVHDVRLEPGVIARLTAGPVELVAEADQPTVDEWAASVEGGIRVRLTGDGEGTVRLRPGVSARVHPELAVEERRIRFHVRRVWLLGIPIPGLHRRVRPREVDLPDLPRDLQITGIEPRPGTLRVRAVIHSMREPIAIDQLVRAASTVGSHVVLNRAGREAQD